MKGQIAEIYERTSELLRKGDRESYLRIGQTMEFTWDALLKKDAGLQKILVFSKIGMQKTKY